MADMRFTRFSWHFYVLLRSAESRRARGPFRFRNTGVEGSNPFLGSIIPLSRRMGPPPIVKKFLARVSLPEHLRLYSMTEGSG